MGIIFQIARLRFFLLIRQRLGMLSFALGIGIVVFSYLLAEVSFIRPQKIFWDFSLAGIFLSQIFLAIYLGTQLVPEESNRRTLHLVLCAGVSRTQWLLGNVLGLSVGLSMMNLLWTLLAFGMNAVLFGGFEDLLGPWLVIQNQVFLALTVVLVLLIGIFFSLLIKSLLALAATASITMLIYSLDSIRRIFLDPESGRFIEDRGIHWVLWLSKIMPPLNWLNLKDLVTYQASLDTQSFMALFGVSMLWTLILTLACSYAFEQKDL